MPRPEISVPTTSPRVALSRPRGYAFKILHILVLLVSLVSAATREYEFTVSESLLAPDGKYKSMKLINGMLPGPVIEADEDDWIIVNVHNNLQVGVTFHFHGILQQGTPWADGVPGITQRPIASGESYTYEFQIRGQCGAFWYHSHFRGYLSDGLYGLIYVRPGSERQRPYELVSEAPEDLELFYELEKKPSFLIADDTFDLSSDALFLRMFEHGIDPLCIRSILINGKGTILCQQGRTFRRLASKNPFLMKIPEFDSMGCVRDPSLKEFHGKDIDHSGLHAPGYSAECQPTGPQSKIHLHFTNGTRWQYINILNAGGQNTKAFSIDDHPFYLVAVDGIFVQPKLLHSLLVPVGSRCTILVETDPEAHENVAWPFAMRFAASHTPQYIEGIAFLVYGDGLEDMTEPTGLDITDYSNGVKYQDLDGRLLLRSDKTCWSHNTIPYELESVLSDTGPADITFTFMLRMFDTVQFTMFESLARIPSDFELSKPLLQKMYEGQLDGLREDYQDNRDVLLSAEILNGQVIDLVINNNKHINHPVHLHGHYMHLLSYSTHEIFPFNSVTEAISANCTTINMENPPLLDVILVPVGGHAVLRFKADNPGIWLLHCHNIGHLMGGMGAILFESLEDIPRLTESS